MLDLHALLTFEAYREREEGGLLGRGYEYAGPHDFVLREGTWFESPTSPHEFPQGTPRACFGNAIGMAVLYGLRYVEGYAVNELTLDAVHHAWNLRDDGSVVDVTWGAYRDRVHVAPLFPACYCGVEFRVERADEATWDGDASVLDDHHRGWPLLREKWRGESEGVVWEPSVRLRALAAGRDGDRVLARELFALVDAEVNGV